MWAAFGSIDKIPPLAFAVPAVFAKSSTLYNPVIYLLLKPNFRNTIAKDFTVLQELCIRSCFCVKASQNYRSTLNTSLRTFKGKNESNCNSLPIVGECPYFPREKHSDAFGCFQNYPKCCQERLSTMECPPRETVSLENNLQAKARQKSVKVVVQGEKSTEIDTLEITLEAVPVHPAFTDL
ncbi:opsin-5-like [Grus japonensis]|uniref:Opsin-5-like n=1 Tax=Grus japonensis TaxID=30415 RepID=A0ABC9WCJ4_GRUJA